jgi:hypothetical protein
MANSKILSKIESLHPKNDAWEIIRLSVFYEFPWDFNRALELALYKTYAVPSISKILFSTKQFEKHPQKRYDDTDIILSEIIENGLDEGRGLEALKRLNFLHSHYKISNDDYLYVLSTFVFDTGRWINQYGYRKLSSHEELAGFFVWKEIGEKMNIKDIPDNIADFEKFHDDYEKENFKYCESNLKIARATENLMLSWYMPSFAFDAARPFLHAVMEPHLLKAFNYKEPGEAMRTLVTNSLRARSKAESLIPRTKPYIRTRDHKHKFYPNGYTLNDLGPEKLKNAPGCPYHKVMQSLQY